MLLTQEDDVDPYASSWKLCLGQHVETGRNKRGSIINGRSIDVWGLLLITSSSKSDVNDRAVDNWRAFLCGTAAFNEIFSHIWWSLPNVGRPTGAARAHLFLSPPINRIEKIARSWFFSPLIDVVYPFIHSMPRPFRSSYQWWIIWNQRWSKRFFRWMIWPKSESDIVARSWFFQRIDSDLRYENGSDPNTCDADCITSLSRSTPRSVRIAQSDEISGLRLQK